MTYSCAYRNPKRFYCVLDNKHSPCLPPFPSPSTYSLLLFLSCTGILEEVWTYIYTCKLSSNVQYMTCHFGAYMCIHAWIHLKSSVFYCIVSCMYIEVCQKRRIYTTKETYIRCVYTPPKRPIEGMCAYMHGLTGSLEKVI